MVFELNGKFMTTILSDNTDGIVLINLQKLIYESKEKTSCWPAH